MDTFVTTDLISVIVTGMPNFIGFLVLSYLMWRIISRQLDILERLVDDCLDRPPAAINKTVKDVQKLPAISTPTG